MTKLHDLSQAQGQSPWLDNLRRDYLRGGTLQALVDKGIRGVTSNPTIFAKAIEGEEDYDDQFRRLLDTLSVEDSYWELVITDIVDALAVLRPVHDESGGIDGYVSLEVAPSLAHDTAHTVTAARRLHERIGRPNLFVKIPATAEGVPAIRAMIGEGRSINVTLIFGLERYAEVMEAYIGGLEDALAAGTTDLSPVRSVASFFVSRVDTEVDRRLETAAHQAPEGPARRALLEARGGAAVAQARQAYQRFLSTFAGPRWEALAARGAKVQRPLWASTSTKNPAYPDLAYVDTLIGPDTVNTMPDATIDAFLDHGVVARTVDADPDGAARTLAELAQLGIDMADVARTLEDEGVASFAKSFDELMQSLEDKANALQAG
ncbi:MAG TPA: transaldolase, partial [Acidimicrobiales bacterium]|nr:transaldolase [Acidimicrobiales bacterium]